VGAFPPIAFADGTSKVGVAVAAVDANRNGVSGQNVSLTMNPESHAIVTSLNSITNVSNGTALFTVTDTVLETVTFTASIGGQTLAQHPAVKFVSVPATAGGISASPTTVNANDSDSTTITVTLQDDKGNPSPGKVVNLSQGNGSSIISGTTATTDATGKVQFTAVDNVAETVTYTALDVSDGNLPVPGSATVNFVNASGFCSSFGHYGIGTAAPGYAVTTFASNFPVDCFLNIGPIGLVFNASGNLLVGDRNNQNIYLFGPQGGTAGPATLLGTVQDPGGVTLLGLTFTKDGRLYGASQNPAKIVEVNPATGTEIRIVVFPAPSGALAVEVDPLSGDLFFSTGDGIFRVTNFANGPGTVTPYCSRAADGIKFAPDGTLYAAAGDAIIRVSGTNAPTPGTVTTLTFLPGHPDGIELEPNAANASKPFLYVNSTDGTITRIDTTLLPDTPPSLCSIGCSDIYTGGSRGDFMTVSPSGCLYATQTDRVIKITKADGTCGLSPANPAPQIVLTPQDVQPSPPQGTPVTFTATLKNVNTPAGMPISLTVIGPNLQTLLERADANGQARFTFAGTFTGIDAVVASATLDAQTLASNVARVNWIDGKHTTFLSMNVSPASGAPNVPLTLTATLIDVSASPTVQLSGAPINFAFAGNSCMATTNAAGAASCSITPNVSPGPYPSTATFAGTAAFLASSASRTIAPGVGWRFPYPCSTGPPRAN